MSGSKRKPPRPLPVREPPTVPRPRPTPDPAAAPPPALAGPPVAEPLDAELPPPYDTADGELVDRPDDGPARMPPLVAPLVAAFVLLVIFTVVVVRAMGGTDDPAPGTTAARDVPEPPVALAPGSSYVESRVTASGALTVRHWIRNKAFVFGVDLTPPAATAGPGRVIARSVRVVADGRVSDGPRVVDSGRARYSFAGAREVFVTYRMDGALQRSDSSTGRALAWVTSLDVGLEPATSRATRVVVGDRILALACLPPGALAVPEPCGAPTRGGWEVRLDGAHAEDRVIAQLDLP
jgi:hypothetical protein